MLRQVTLLLMAVGVLVISSVVQAADISSYKQAINYPDTTAYSVSINGQKVTFSELVQLPLYATTFASKWGESGTFVGVRVLDVLKKYGVDEFKLIYLVAGDGYKVSFSSRQEGLDEALLAFQLNDELLPLGTKGPYWLIWPSSAEQVAAQKASGSLWIWGIAEIHKAR